MRDPAWPWDLHNRTLGTVESQITLSASPASILRKKPKFAQKWCSRLQAVRLFVALTNLTMELSAGIAELRNAGNFRARKRSRMRAVQSFCQLIPNGDFSVALFNRYPSVNIVVHLPRDSED